MKAKLRKKAHKVIRFEGGVRNKVPTFMEFGWIENPTFGNDIYILINSAHQGGTGYWELRTDEALLFVHGLAMALNSKQGMKLERMM